jgi:hypothetical protein
MLARVRLERRRSGPAVEHILHSLVESTVVFVAAIFLVAWLLEDLTYFSLSVGIPAGRVARAVAFPVQISLSKRNGLGRPFRFAVEGPLLSVLRV